MGQRPQSEKKCLAGWRAFGMTLALLIAGSLALGARDPAVEGRLLRMGDAKSLIDQELILGHARIRFSGQAVPLFLDGRKVGVFLEGKGTLGYQASFLPGSQVFHRNVEEWTGEKTQPAEGGPRVELPFTAARLFWRGDPWSASSGPPSEAPGSSANAFAKRWEGIRGHIPFHQLALQESNSPGGTLAIGEFEQGSKAWVFIHDETEGMTESLNWVHTYEGGVAEFKGIRWLVPLSRTPLGWDPRRGYGPIHAQITGLDLDLRTKDNRSVEMVVEEAITPWDDGLRRLRFGLWKRLASTEGHRGVTVNRVTDAEGRLLEFDHQNGSLLVDLPAPTRRGQPFRLRFEYKGDFLIQPEGNSYWELGAGEPWYPSLGHWGEESFTFHGTARTIGDWIAFLPGDTVQRGRDGAWNLQESQTSVPIRYPSVLGGRYFLDEETQDGLTIRVATYAFKGGPGNAFIKSQAFKVIHYYQGFLGRFPFKELKIIQRNEMGGGQAPPGMMYLTKEAFDQIGTIRALQDYAAFKEVLREHRILTPLPPPPATSTNIRHLFAHEIAHQYWGILVKAPGPEEQWVSESFSDYCAALFVRDAKGKDAYTAQRALWAAEAKEAISGVPIPLANDIRTRNPSKGQQTRRALLYDRGPLLLAALHDELGDKTFLTWLSSIQANFNGRDVSTWRMFDLLKFMTKKDHQPFLDATFWGTAPVK